MEQDAIDQKNISFWDELCDPSGEALGILRFPGIAENF
jgi:hypothetical protein